MEVKPGYKQTEIGVIPEDWEVSHLSKLCTLIVDGTHQTPQYVSVGVPFYSVENVVGNRFTDSKHISMKEHQNISKRALPHKGDILLTRIGSLGSTKLVDWEYESSIYVSLALLRFNQSVDNSFIYSYTKSWSFRKSIQDRALMNAIPIKINMCMIGQIPIPIPSKTEQREIGNAISNIDSLITSLEKLIEKKKLIKQGVMQDFLTGKKRLPGFTGEWETKSLDEILSYERPDKYYVTNTEYADAGLVPVLTANKSFVLGYTNDTDGICHNIPAIIFDDFTTDSKYVDFPFKVKSSAIKILRTKHNGDVLLLIYCILQMISFPLGDHKRYYLSEYRYLSIKIPGKVEQKALSAYLEDMESEIKTLEKQLAKYQLIKEGMMQELLTGRIRLI